MIKQKNRDINKKFVSSAVIVLAVGIALYFYRRNKIKIDELAADAYEKLSAKFKYAEDIADNFFS